MPRTMLTDQHWSKLKFIFVNFDIYLKHNLRLFVKALLYQIRTGCPWRDHIRSFASQILCLRNSVVGAKVVSC